MSYIKPSWSDWTFTSLKEPSGVSKRDFRTSNPLVYPSRVSNQCFWNSTSLSMPYGDPKGFRTFTTTFSSLTEFLSGLNCGYIYQNIYQNLYLFPGLPQLQFLITCSMWFTKLYDLAEHSRNFNISLQTFTSLLTSLPKSQTDPFTPLPSILSHPDPWP